ncbi:hypothetical protein [Streptomyces sp. NPDC047108]|uniref:hypothetical protein n=1 Tax=Streptomyces sp. NPDC047108 TaxID=3155025 RepID=UPI0033CBF162
MAEHPTPEDASRALSAVERGRDQAREALREPRWLSVFWAVLAFLFLASFDVLDEDHRIWSYAALNAVLFLHLGLLHSRRGSALIGRTSAGMPLRDVPPAYLLVLTAVLIGVGAAGVAAVALIPFRLDDVPYWHTLLGLVLAILMMLFARKIQDLQLRLLRHTRRTSPTDAHGCS